MSYTVNSRQTDSQRRRDKGALRFFALRVGQQARLREREFREPTDQSQRPPSSTVCPGSLYP